MTVLAALVALAAGLVPPGVTRPGATAPLLPPLLRLTQALAQVPPGGPVLVVVDPADPFGDYYTEILRAEGLNEFSVAPVGSLSAQSLGGYQVVLLAQTAVSDAQAAMLRTWVTGGGNLIAMRPDARLAGLLGLGSDTGDLADAYLQVAPDRGVTSQSIQFHGVADRWTPGSATTVATLLSDATTETGNPAVTLQSVGSAGGQAAAFTYDLARSVVETRQGNPAWAGDDRDRTGDGVIRSDDLFFGAKPGDARPDWVDLGKVAIPQADEQQRLLANLITQMSADRLPLPRFWYLPRGEKAAVVMTGDDHAAGGTTGQFDRFHAADPPGCSVADWECVRATSYVYPGTAIPRAQEFQADGFEIALHLNTGCANFTRASLLSTWTQQLGQFRAAFPGLAPPATERTHCIVWSDWAGSALAEAANGVRLDTNYYYWPGSWVRDRPGLFTGSGMPMRFADADGSLIDVYQATTQLTDESNITIPAHIAALLDAALGPAGYYGVFTANMHTDQPQSAGADAIVAAARQRGVPVISARQLLDWLDARNGSSFQGLSFTSNQLTFSIQPASGARGLRALLPVTGPTGRLTRVTRAGADVATTPITVKGVDYVSFDAAAGGYTAFYGSPPPAPPPPPPPPPPPTATQRTTPTTPSAVATGRPVPGAAADRRAPRVLVRPHRVRVSAAGNLTLRVRCPADERSCRVRLRLRLGAAAVAERTLTVAGGRTRAFRLRLGSPVRRRLARDRSLRVRVVAGARARAGNPAPRRPPLRLHAPRR